MTVGPLFPALLAEVSFTGLDGLDRVERDAVFTDADALRSHMAQLEGAGAHRVSAWVSVAYDDGLCASADLTLDSDWSAFRA